MAQIMMLTVTATGAVYLKNMILHHWISSGDATAAEFVIHDSAKDIIRDNVVDAVVVSESLVRLTVTYLTLI